MMGAPFIIVVSGLPRSGTSLLMQEMAAGGLEILFDGKREPDKDNSRGYFELEEVKGLARGEHEWLERARGRVVKVVVPLVTKLPDSERYKILFVERDVDDVIVSQNTMIKRRGFRPIVLSQVKLGLFLKSISNEAKEELRKRPNCELLTLRYPEDLVFNLKTKIREIEGFIEHPLNRKALSCPDPNLWHQRKSHEV